MAELLEFAYSGLIQAFRQLPPRFQVWNSCWLGKQINAALILLAIHIIQGHI
jgi:hypothetical protein